MRRSIVALIAGTALLLVGGSVAFACTNLATLNLGASAAEAGDSIEVTGSSFRTADRGGQEVVLRWDALDAPALATVMPDASGTISTSVTIPADAPGGHHVLMATQESVSDDGEVSDAYGTPARATILVGGPAGGEAEAPRPAANPAAVADGGSITLVAMTIGLGVLGIALFGAGVGFYGRARRQEPVPAPARQQRK